jgi:hypothetical protein
LHIKYRVLNIATRSSPNPRLYRLRVEFSSSILAAGGFFDSVSHPAGGESVRLDLLIWRALRNASPAEAERIRRALREGRVAEVLPELVKLAEREGPLDIYYVSEGRFEAAEEREEVVGEVEEAVAEDGLEPVGEAEEVVEGGEYLGQHVVRRALPEKPELRRKQF